MWGGIVFWFVFWINLNSITLYRGMKNESLIPDPSRRTFPQERA